MKRLGWFLLAAFFIAMIFANFSVWRILYSPSLGVEVPLLHGLFFAFSPIAYGFAASYATYKSFFEKDKVEKDKSVERVD